MLCSVKFRSKIITCEKGKFLKHNHDYKLGNTLQSVQPQLAMCGISSFIDIAIIKGYCINGYFTLRQRYPVQISYFLCHIDEVALIHITLTSIV